MFANNGAPFRAGSRQPAATIPKDAWGNYGGIGKPYKPNSL